jgi:hypothetical protein
MGKWGTDGSTLPQSILYNVTVRYEPQSLKDYLPTPLLQYYTRTNASIFVSGDDISTDTSKLTPACRLSK